MEIEKCNLCGKQPEVIVIDFHQTQVFCASCNNYVSGFSEEKAISNWNEVMKSKPKENMKAHFSTSRKGYTRVKQFPEGEEVVSMVKHGDRIVVATNKSVYLHVPGSKEFEPMEFWLKDKE